MKILNATFLKSASKISEAPGEDFAEVAFLGRSNVGKSTLINLLTNKKNLAKSSATPGKTRVINFFEVDAVVGGERVRFRLVDLPGFGYAKVSKRERELWEKNLTKFLLGRSSIKLFCLLRDSRHPQMEIDDEVKEFLGGLNRFDYEVLEVFTKTDKLTKNELSILKSKKNGAVFVSAQDKSGLEQLLSRLSLALFGEERFGTS